MKRPSIFDVLLSSERAGLEAWERSIEGFLAWTRHPNTLATAAGASSTARVPEYFVESGLLVAWIEETGRRLTDIAELALVLRWSGGGHAGAWLSLAPLGSIAD